MQARMNQMNLWGKILLKKLRKNSIFTWVIPNRNKNIRPAFMEKSNKIPLRQSNCPYIVKIDFSRNNCKHNNTLRS